MAKLPVLSGKKLIKALERGGFTVVKQKGSHVSLQKENHRTVVPLHNDLAKGTLRSILKQCGLSQKDLLNLLKK